MLKSEFRPILRPDHHTLDWWRNVKSYRSWRRSKYPLLLHLLLMHLLLLHLLLLHLLLVLEAKLALQAALALTLLQQFLLQSSHLSQSCAKLKVVRVVAFLLLAALPTRSATLSQALRFTVLHYRDRPARTKPHRRGRQLSALARSRQ